MALMDDIIQIEGVSKDFSGVTVLDRIGLSVKKGEVHGIIGENGAGKSTLMKILSGIHPPSSGTIHFRGKPLRLDTPHQAMAAGISMIHQELNLIDELTVADNIFLGREKVKRGLIDVKKSARGAAEALAHLKSTLDPLKKVKELSMAEKQLVEIAKAISLDVEVLIMDEPTSVLTDKEINAMFDLIRELKGQGITIFYISHKLNEVKRICDRVTVLRDGQLVETRDIDEVTVHDLANLMVGREIENYYPEKGVPGEKVVFGVQDLSVPGLLEDISFNLREGEILGFFGLVGAGRTELAEAIMGIRPRMSGKIFLDESELPLKDPEEAIKANLAYLSEDRQGRALVTSLQVNHNTTLISLKQYCHPFVAQQEENRATTKYVDKLNIKVNSVDDTVRNLSGGNQQKVAFAKWFETEPRILILDEPTRGIDVNAKREIYEIIKAQAQTGKSCIIISSELPELLGTCHRIVVMRNGRISGEIDGAEATEEKVMYLATGIGMEKEVG